MDDSSSDGGSTAAATTSSSVTAYLTFRSLVGSADKKFAAVRDLPTYTVGSASRYSYCYNKVFKAYTRLWRFQQEHRKELMESGMRRWEIGEIASRIGQLYYCQYQRSSELRFLVEAYVFYEAVWSRRYFEEQHQQQDHRRKNGKMTVSSGGGGYGSQKGGKNADLGLRGKELRFYARFIVVALLLNRMEVVRQLVDKFRSLLDDCRISFPDTNFKEWKPVLQEIIRFLKADSSFPNSRPLRYNGLFDSHPSSHPYIARFHPTRVLKLQDAILAGYRRNEVKYAELTLDSFRMLQSLEWEPSGSFYQKGPPEGNNNCGYSDISGASGLIEINFSTEMIDSSLPPNPHKAILHRPAVPQLIAVIAAICEELSVDSALLIYLSSSGKSDQNIAIHKENFGALRNSNTSTGSRNQDHCIISPLQTPTHNKDYSGDCPGNYLCLGSRGNGMDKLYPADLLSFTRRPIFLIIDSDTSNAFKGMLYYAKEKMEKLIDLYKGWDLRSLIFVSHRTPKTQVIHGRERGEAAALLLSPEKSVLPSKCASDGTAKGSQFTFFLTAPLHAFFQLIDLTDLDLDQYNSAELVLSTTLAKWEVLLCTAGSSLDRVWAQVFSDPFLRRLILRFIFCRSVLYLFNYPEKSSRHLPCCLPKLPDSVSPESSSVRSSIHHLAESLGVVNLFQFSESVEESSDLRSS